MVLQNPPNIKLIVSISMVAIVVLRSFVVFNIYFGNFIQNVGRLVCEAVFQHWSISSGICFSISLFVWETVVAASALVGVQRSAFVSISLLLRRVFVSTERSYENCQVVHFFVASTFERIG